MNRPPVKAVGWLEILLRLTPLGHLNSVEDLDPDDYMMVGGPLPITEFDGPFQVYETCATDPEHLGMPRPMQRYDIILAVMRTGKDVDFKTINLLMINEAEDRHLIYPKAYVQWKEEFPLVALPLKGSPIQSMRKKE